MSNAGVSCSFCGVADDESRLMISTPDKQWTRSYICAECVLVCMKILDDEIGVEHVASEIWLAGECR